MRRPDRAAHQRGAARRRGGHHRRARAAQAIRRRRQSDGGRGVRDAEGRDAAFGRDPWRQRRRHSLSRLRERAARRAEGRGARANHGAAEGAGAGEVYFPSPFEGHAEHVVTNEIARAACAATGACPATFEFIVNLKRGSRSRVCRDGCMPWTCRRIAIASAARSRSSAVTSTSSTPDSRRPWPPTTTTTSPPRSPSSSSPEPGVGPPHLSGSGCRTQHLQPTRPSA